MRLVVVFLFLITLTPMLTAAQQDFSFSIDVEPKEIQLGKSFTVTLALTFPKGYKPETHKIVQRALTAVNLLAPRLDLLSQTFSPIESSTEEIEHQTMTLHLYPLVPGKFTLDFLLLPFLRANSQKPEYNLPGKIIVVEILIPEAAKTAEKSISPEILPFSQYPLVTVDKENIKAVEEQTRNLRLWSEHDLPPLWKMLLYSCLILMLWNYQFIKDLFSELNERWKKMKDPKKYALDALQRVINEKNRSSDQINPDTQQYYIQLSDILRDYLEQKHQLPAKHKTTPEFLDVLSKKADFNQLHKMLLGELLKNADLVKFAKYRPTNEDCEHAILATKQFIEAH